MKTLSDICEVYSGYALKEFNDQNEGLPVIKIGNIMTDGTLTLEDCQYTSEVVNEKYYSKKGDIYVALSGATTGKIGILVSEERHVINQRVGVVRRKDDDVPQQFVKYFLMRQTDRILQEASGCAQPNISPKQIAQYEVPKLSKTEMEEISNILDKISYVITQRKDELQKLDELIKARFVELSNKWNASELPLSDFLDDITYGFTNPMPDSNVGPWKITAKDVVNGHINFETARKTTQEAYDSLTAKSKPIIGDVLLTKDGTLGRTAIVEDEKICVNQSVAVLRCNNKVLPRFLALLLQLPEYQVEMTKNSGGGTIKHIYITKVDKMLVKIPDINSQKELISFVEQVDKSKVGGEIESYI